MATDTLDAVSHYWPAANLWLLDDCTDDETFGAIEAWSRDHGAQLLRNPTPQGYHGLAQSVFTLYRAIAAHSVTVPTDFVLKLDPDACILGAELEHDLRSRFAANGPGIVGAYRVQADGRGREWRRQRRNMLLDLLLPIGPHKSWRALRIGRPYWAHYLRSARRNGYVFGEHVLGGAYAIHTSTVRALNASGFLDIPARYRGLTVEEDVLLGLGAKAIGHGLIDIGTDLTRSPAWIQFRSPLPLAAETFLARGVRVVHPVKDSSDGAVMRTVFRQHRRSMA
jgi:hypothetical protein